MSRLPWLLILGAALLALAVWGLLTGQPLGLCVLVGFFAVLLLACGWTDLMDRLTNRRRG